MQVRLDMEDAGWLTLTLVHGPQTVRIDGGYLVDSPRDLLEALVTLMAGGEREARVIFNQEPGEWVLRLRMLSGRLLRIEVHGPGEDGPPEPLGEPVFRHTEPVERFASRVRDEFQRQLSEEYDRRWGLSRFPRRAFDALGTALEIR
jgi:hypothetical protein